VTNEVLDRPEKHRYEIAVDGEPAGFAAYALRGSSLTLSHTEVDPAYEGRGLGSVLVRHVLDEARERGLEVLPVCPFVRAYLQRHDEYVALVPEDARARYGLA
jgi:predicted GNAT family acetyltransferase